MADPAEPTFVDSLYQSWSAMALAPQKLMQSFNNGWSFGNLTINSSNSSAPETEQAIVAAESYGRQIGKLLDAVALLADRQPDAAEKEPFQEVAALKKKIDDVKHGMAVARIKQLRGDLESLRLSPDKQDRKRYLECIAELRLYLAKLPPDPTEKQG